ncbi:hypothetical protein RR48_04862 [Papilio machaon]|uniref:Uncharacterized protein n=1 Tax=Papilio machaon TaxID=76193 RepID=A0A0N1PHR7_PAPMA|nr:hypothetical protein RR48_04862 [Papilio machaon]
MFTKIFILIILGVVEIKGDLGIKYVMRMYEDCQHSNLIPCLKKKAILFFDRAARMDSIPVVNGIDIVKGSDIEMPPISENEIDSNLPRGLGSEDETLSAMLWDKIAAFANSRTVQFSLPKMSGEELNRGVEEGRGKMKKMMGMMMMGGVMKLAAMIPLAMAGLFVLAGKALIVSKIALLLAGILAIKKIISQKSSGGGHESHGWSSGGGSGGWDKRSHNDVSDLAYSAYKTE